MSAEASNSVALSLDGKVAMVVGAGQTPGATIGNGRATSLLFARAGATVIALDRDLASAEETVAMIDGEGKRSEAIEVDVTDGAALEARVRETLERHGRIDILQNNVGVAYTAGDSALAELSEEAFDRVMAINLRGTIMACKHAFPAMCAQGAGVITNISSVAAEMRYDNVTYKASKAAMVAFTRQLALDGAPHGVRANTILPGLMDTPMAVDTRVGVAGKTRADLVAERNAQVPLLGQMGTAWDVANASLFLASDAARFITGVALPVDGGALARIG